MTRSDTDGPAWVLTNKQFAYSDVRDDVYVSLESSCDLLMHGVHGYAPDFFIKSTDTTHRVTGRVRNVQVHKISTHLITNFLIGSTLEGFVGTKWGSELHRVNLWSYANGTSCEIHTSRYVETYFCHNATLRWCYRLTPAAVPQHFRSTAPTIRPPRQ